MEYPSDLITGADAARIIGVVPARMNGWRKRDDGKGPPFYVVEIRIEDLMLHHLKLIAQGQQTITRG